ncbi:OmpA family protein [Falsiroseomonas sp. HW251]|uniref:OmpA family protein n=1 Tax=Falsiroseomonas sp. HW251 TaxID=3390998 RepID=UPI003D31A3ED
MRRRAALLTSLGLPALVAACGNRQRMDLLSQPTRSVFFADDSVALDAAAQGVVRDVSDTYKRYTRTWSRIQLVGYVAPEPGQAPLVSLSRARAEAVRNALIADGVPGNIITFEGRGAAAFSSPDMAVEARRVDIRFAL